MDEYAFPWNQIQRTDKNFRRAERVQIFTHEGLLCFWIAQVLGPDVELQRDTRDYGRDYGAHWIRFVEHIRSPAGAHHGYGDLHSFHQRLSIGRKDTEPERSVV